MGGTPIFCPECKSANADYFNTRDGYVCAECNHFFKEERPVEPLSIFLSYGHDDKVFVADRIKKELEAMGHEVWYDLDKIKCGMDWDKRINDGLEWVSKEGSRARFVLLMTPHSVRKEEREQSYCLNELARALERQVPVFPVMIEWCEPPLAICRIQWMDMRNTFLGGEVTGRFEGCLRELVHALDQNNTDFDGALVGLRTVLDPIPFEANAMMHIRRFVGREWIIKEIDEWLAKEKADRVFWITGGPGTGKSALASWLHFYYDHIKAFYLCKAPSTTSKGIYEPGDPRWFVRTIAYYLSAMLPDYRVRLNQLDLKRIVKVSSAESMFERLIAEALYGIRFSGERPAVVLVDGLDELTVEGRNELAEFLVRQFPKTPEWLRMIICSRYEPPLVSDLQRYRDNRHEIERDKACNDKENVYCALIEEDLRRFIEKEFSRFAGKGELDAGTIDTLMNKSEGNFLYLEQLRDSLEKGHLSFDDVDSFPKGLGEYYMHFFSRKFPDKHGYGEYYDKLAVIISVKTPLTWAEAESIFGWQRGNERVEFKSRLGALFNYDNDQITPFHKSLVEWITDKDERAGRFWIRPEDGHRQLADTGYGAYKNGGAAPNAGELKCLSELPIHLIALRDIERLSEFLSDLCAFVTYFGENIFTYIGYWNAMCRGDAQKRWSLHDCTKILSKQFDTCDLLKETNPGAYEAYYSIGRLFFELRDHEGAARMYQRSIASMPEGCEDSVRARLYNEAGEAFCQSGLLEDAEENYRKALEIRRRIYTAHPELAESINNNGHVPYNRMDYEKALGYYDEALRMWKNLPGGPHYGEADTLNNIAMCFWYTRTKNEAMRTFKECGRALDRLSCINWGIPICRNNLGGYFEKNGLLDEALRQYRLAYDFSMKNYGPEHEMTINSVNNIALLYLNNNMGEEAVSQLNEVKEMCERLYGANNSKTIHALNMIGVGILNAGKYMEARELFQDMVNRIGRSEDRDKEVEAAVYHNMGGVCSRQGDYDEAVFFLQKALHQREEIYPLGDENIISTFLFIVDVFTTRKAFDEIDRLTDGFYDRQISGMEKDSYSYYEFLEQLGRGLRNAGRWKSAEKYYREIIIGGEKLLGSTDVEDLSGDYRVFNISTAYNEIAFHGYVPEQNWAEAERYYRRAVELVKIYGNDKEYTNMRLNLLTTLHRAGKPLDYDELRRLTDVLGKSGDSRSEKGKKILQEKGM